MSDDLIRARAYEIWEREGRIEGRELDHWLEAQAELTAAAMAAQDADVAPEPQADQARPKRKRAAPQRTSRAAAAAASGPEAGDHPAPTAAKPSRSSKPRRPRARKAAPPTHAGA
ncbi:MAG: DUF2934 domain-containing protein [Pseudomonadota bacterium]